MKNKYIMSDELADKLKDNFEEQYYIVSKKNFEYHSENVKLRRMLLASLVLNVLIVLVMW